MSSPGTIYFSWYKSFKRKQIIAAWAFKNSGCLPKNAQARYERSSNLTWVHPKLSIPVDTKTSSGSKWLLFMITLVYTQRLIISCKPLIPLRVLQATLYPPQNPPGKVSGEASGHLKSRKKPSLTLYNIIFLLQERNYPVFLPATVGCVTVFFSSTKLL